MKNILLFTGTFLLSPVLHAQYDYDWAHTFAQGHFSYGHSVTHDHSGNILTTGATQLPFDIDPGPDSTILGAQEHIHVAKFSTRGNFMWGFEIPTYAPYATAHHILCDHGNNVIVAGACGDSTDFDPGPNTALFTGSWLGSGFIAKYDSAGNFQWYVPMVGNKTPFPDDVVCDDAGNIYVVGSFKDTLDLDPTSNVNPLLISTNITSLFWCKYDPSGHLLWARQTSGGINTYAQGGGIAVAQNGNIVLDFVATGSIDVDPGPVVQLTPGYLGYTILYTDPNGDLLDYGYLDGNTNLVYPGDVAIDLNGDIILTGSFGGTLDLDPGPGTFNLSTTNPNFTSAFFLKLLPSGIFLNAYQLSGQYSEIRHVTIDAANNFWISGSTSGTVDFDPSANIYAIAVMGGEDGFVAAYSPQFSFLTYINLGCDTAFSNDDCTGVSCFGSQVVATGYIDGPTDFDPGSGSAVMGATQGRSMFLAAYDLYVGVDENVNSTATNVFPNPARDVVNVQLPASSSGGQVTLVDARGAIVLSQQCSGGNTGIDVSTLARGVYVLHFRDAETSSATRVVIQ